MALGRLPVPVGRLVVEHEQERPRRVPPGLEEIDGHVREDVGDVAGMALRAVFADQVGIVVIALPGEDRPVVEARRVALEVPLADKGRLVARRPQELGKGRLASVEGDGVVADPVEVTVFPGQDDRPARGADAVRAEAVLEADALAGDPVDPRRPVESAPVAADGLGGVVVGHDEQDVGPPRRPDIDRTADERQGQGAQTRGFEEIASSHGASLFRLIAWAGEDGQPARSGGRGGAPFHPPFPPKG